MQLYICKVFLRSGGFLIVDRQHNYHYNYVHISFDIYFSNTAATVKDDKVLVVHIRTLAHGHSCYASTRGTLKYSQVGGLVEQFI